MHEWPTWGWAPQLGRVNPAPFPKWKMLMGFSCCFYLSGGHEQLGRWGEWKERRWQDSGRCQCRLGAKGTQGHKSGGHHCGVDIKYKTGWGHIQMREKRSEEWATRCSLFRGQCFQRQVLLLTGVVRPMTRRQLPLERSVSLGRVNILIILRPPTYERGCILHFSVLFHLAFEMFGRHLLHTLLHLHLSNS